MTRFIASNWAKIKSEKSRERDRLFATVVKSSESNQRQRKYESYELNIMINNKEVNNENLEISAGKTWVQNVWDNKERENH